MKSKKSRTLIIGDSHISEENIPELENIFKEIFSIPATKLIHLGDFYDKSMPTPKEISFGTRIAKEMKKKYKDVTILAGNGGHEYYHEGNITDYLTVLGINIEKGNYEFDNILMGHWMLNESKLEYGSGRCSMESLKQYKWVFLGHQHLFQKFSETIYHPGSIFFKTFGEIEDEYKRVIIIEDGKLTFVPLKSPIPMKDIYSIEEGEKLDKKTKVRLIFKDFEEYKENINKINNLKNKFHRFQLKLDFKEEEKQKEEVKPKKKVELMELFKKAVSNIKDKDVKSLIESQL